MKQDRFHIIPGENSVERRIISNTGIELPRINYARVNTQPYRYIFGAGNTIPGNFLDNLTKIDISNSHASVWHEEGCYPGEPVFVERPQATAEDDGLLLSIVLDAVSQTSFLLLLDAGTMQEIARAITPQHITFGFHGQYLSGNDPDKARNTIHR